MWREVSFGQSNRGAFSRTTASIHSASGDDGTLSRPLSSSVRFDPLQTFVTAEPGRSEPRAEFMRSESTVEGFEPTQCAVFPAANKWP